MSWKKQQLYNFAREQLISILKSTFKKELFWTQESWPVKSPAGNMLSSWNLYWHKNVVNSYVVNIENVIQHTNSWESKLFGSMLPVDVSWIPFVVWLSFLTLCFGRTEMLCLLCFREPRHAIPWHWTIHPSRNLWNLLPDHLPLQTRDQKPCQLTILSVGHLSIRTT